MAAAFFISLVKLCVLCSGGKETSKQAGSYNSAQHQSLSYYRPVIMTVMKITNIYADTRFNAVMTHENARLKLQPFHLGRLL
jgi:hypothetical protein